MKSIQKRLTLLLLAGLGCLIVIGGGIVYPAVRRILLAEFDYALRAKVRAMTMFPDPKREGLSLEFFTDRILPEFQQTDSPEYFQVWLRDGAVLARSPSLGDDSLPRRAGPPSAPLFWDLTLPDGTPGRAVGVGFIPETEEGKVVPRRAQQDASAYAVTVVLARDTARLAGTLHALLAGILLGGAALALLMAAAIARVVKAGLKPLDALAEQVTQIDTDSLRVHFSTAQMPRELRPIGDQLNNLMERLRQAFQRERRFSANVAHELATPISELRSLAEVALKWRDDPEATAAVSAEALDIAKQMQSLVGALRSLARCEAGLQEIKEESVAVSEMIEEICEGLKDRVSQRSLALERSLAPGLVIQTDAGMCRSIFSNLLDNAVEYAPEGGKIACQLQSEGPGFVFLIANDCDGLKEDDLPHLFEPLWRGDPTRSDSSHAGLGLALVKAFAERLGMDVRAELPGPGTFRIIVRVVSGESSGAGRRLIEIEE